MGMERPTASVCIALAVGRFHHTRRPSADEPRCVVVGHRAALRPPEALPFCVSRLLSKSKQPSLRRAMRSGSTGSPVTGSLTTRLRLQRCASRRRFAMTSADRRARTSRGGRPAPRAKCPSGRCAGRGRAGRGVRAHVVGSILPNGSSTFRLPPSSRSSGEASVPVSQFHGRSSPLRPIHSPPPPSRHSLQLLRHMPANLSTLFSYPSKA